MLAETGHPARARRRARSPRALARSTGEIDRAGARLYGRGRGFLLPDRGGAAQRASARISPGACTPAARATTSTTRCSSWRCKTRIDDLAARPARLVATLIDGRGARARHADRRLHPRPAGAAHTFGHYLARGRSRSLLRDLERLDGGARGSSTSRPWARPRSPPRAFRSTGSAMAELLGFAAPLENSYGCIASVDYVTATYARDRSSSSCISGGRSRTCSSGRASRSGRSTCPNAFVQISSIMPQKRNPVPIEHLRHLASQTVGRARAMLDVVHNTPFTDMNDSEGETQEMGYGAFASGAPRARPPHRARCRRCASTAGASPRTSGAAASRSRSSPTASCGSRACRSARRTRSRPPSRAPSWPTDGDLPQRRLRALRRGLRAGDRARARRSTRSASPRSSRPSISSPCAAGFGGPAPEALDAALAGYRRAPRRARRARPTRSRSARPRPRASSPTRFAALSGEPLMAAIELHERRQALRQGHGRARHRPRRSPTASSSCWSAPRAAASRRRCA